MSLCVMWIPGHGPSCLRLAEGDTLSLVWWDVPYVALLPQNNSVGLLCDWALDTRSTRHGGRVAPHVCSFEHEILHSLGSSRCPDEALHEET
jgi:hypothetical protein